MKKLSICIPTYNEKENIEILINKIQEILKNININYEIIIVDDNSPDGTGKIIDKLAEKFNNIKPVHRKKKEGLAMAYIAGFRSATGDMVITMDADLSHDPKSILDFIKASKYYDIVIGSRFVPGGGNFNRSRFRVIVSRLTNILATLFLKVKSSDSTSGYRLYHRRVLENILQYVSSQKFSFQVEILEKSKYFEFKIGQVPIQFYDRKFGKSKFNAREVGEFLAIIFEKIPILNHLRQLRRLVEFFKRLFS
ncbi:MAG: polyprenol monophosphomannose synthase [Candidatus Helarchaeota archaeon]|nr:polyprenol monophosphomannose synthase [Candidatus Helarchaeota archaeon]